MKSLFSAMASWISHDLLLTVSCLLVAPMYSLLMVVAVYGAALYYAIESGYTWLTTLLLLYLPYCVVDSRPTIAPTSDRMYRVTEWCRSLPIFVAAALYFPVTLHKTADLDPTKSYLFLYHPHGVIGMGCCSALYANGCGFDMQFPGVKRHGVTLNVQFWTPLYREWMMCMGFISANKQTLVETLRNGRSVILVPGGAQEALLAHKGLFRLYINHRKGFIKVAMEANALPVPVLGFGENNAFDTILVDDPNESQQPQPQPPHRDADAVAGAGNATKATCGSTLGSLVHTLQQRLYKVTTFSIPIVTKVRPNRTPIDVVVGKPIQFKGTTVDECHAEYWRALRQLYDEHKAVYGFQDVQLEFM